MKNFYKKIKESSVIEVERQCNFGLSEKIGIKYSGSSEQCGDK